MDFTNDNPPAPPNTPIITSTTKTKNQYLPTIPAQADFTRSAPLSPDHIVPFADSSNTGLPKISIPVSNPTAPKPKPELEHLCKALCGFTTDDHPRAGIRARVTRSLRIKFRTNGIAKRIRCRENVSSIMHDRVQDMRILKRNIRCVKERKCKRQQEMKERQLQRGGMRKREERVKKEEVQGTMGEKEEGEGAASVVDMFGKMEIGDREEDVSMMQL